MSRLFTSAFAAAVIPTDHILASRSMYPVYPVVIMVANQSAHTVGERLSLSFPNRLDDSDFSIPCIIDLPRCVLIIAFTAPIQNDEAIPCVVDCKILARPFVVSDMVPAISNPFTTHQRCEL